MSPSIKWPNTIHYGKEPVVALARHIVGNATSVVLVEHRPPRPAPKSPEPAPRAKPSAKPRAKPAGSPLLSWAALLDDDAEEPSVSVAVPAPTVT
jgi:hypothetical protein